ncbi:MAG: dynamin family protein [Planctomycetia bacterium]|nr:dynamin family protein [Planctomycetia bacterium]
MNITGSERRAQLIEWAENVRDAIRADDAGAAAAIDQAIAQFREGRFLVTILGKAKRGKSTLVNALLGRRDDSLAPIDKLPASNVISRFMRSDTPFARVHYRSVDSTAAGETISLERIRDYVTEEGNPGNDKNVETVEIGGPFENFDPDLVLVDTPGAGSVHRYHDELLQAFIPRSDAVVFLVTANMPIDQDELELLKKVKAADIAKILFVVNKVDASSEADIVDAVTHNRRCLAQVGIAVDEIHRLSAKSAHRGDTESSGLNRLAEALRQTIAAGKGAIIEQRFIRRAIDAATPIFRARACELSLAEAEPEELRRRQEEFAAARGRLAERETRLPQTFLRRWNGALDEFQANVIVARESTKAAAADLVRNASLMSVSRLTRDLPSLLQQSIDAALATPAEKLECELQAACRELEAGYESWSTELMAMSAGARGDATMLVGTAAALAAGFGIVSAGQAAVAAAVTYITTPTIVGGLLQSLIGTSAGFITSTAVPVAAPAWVAMAAPLGWTVAGIGSLAIPFAWALAKSKQKGRLETDAVAQVATVFGFIIDERIPQLRRTAEAYLDEYRGRSRTEESRLEEVFRRAKQPLDAALIAVRRQECERLQGLLAGPLRLTDGSVNGGARG